MGNFETCAPRSSGVISYALTPPVRPYEAKPRLTAFVEDLGGRLFCLMLVFTLRDAPTRAEPTPNPNRNLNPNSNLGHRVVALAKLKSASLRQSTAEMTIWDLRFYLMNICNYFLTKSPQCAARNTLKLAFFHYAG